MRGTGPPPAGTTGHVAMTKILDDAFLTRPLAHRGLHGATTGHAENSRAAFQAAIDAGYGIECDVQLSRDGQAMVFHDYALQRLTAESGPLRQRNAAELGAIPLTGESEGIPTLAEVLALVNGHAPLLIEIKDQDGALGTDVGALEEAVATDLARYEGPVAVMGFNPHSVHAMAERAPRVARGLVTCAFTQADWPLVPAARLEELSLMEDRHLWGVDFISHDRKDLDNPVVAQTRAEGLAVLCWTVRSAPEERQARTVANNITFEGYLPELPSFS